MYKIYKYILNETQQEIEMPKGAKILSAEVQNLNIQNFVQAFNNPSNPSFLQDKTRQIVVYALVDIDEQEKEKKSFYVVGTGWDVPEEIKNEYTFLKTIKIYNGTLIFHVWYK